MLQKHLNTKRCTCLEMFIQFLEFSEFWRSPRVLEVPAEFEVALGSWRKPSEFKNSLENFWRSPEFGEAFGPWRKPLEFGDTSRNFWSKPSKFGEALGPWRKPSEFGRSPRIWGCPRIFGGLPDVMANTVVKG
jgi:hypothetical protein